MNDDDECLFTYPPEEEPEPIVHKVIGVCEDCGEDAHLVMDVRKREMTLCFGCEYGYSDLDD